MTYVGAFFLLLVIYQLKHFLADYVLQGRYQLGKFKDGTEWILPLLSHVAVHAGFTFIIANVFFLIWGVNDLGLAIEIALFDATVHFVMDRLKAGKKHLGRYKPLTASEYMLASGVVASSNATDSYRGDCQRRLRGNKLFWISLGLDQAVHHLTHYICVYMILRTLGLA